MHDRTKMSCVAVLMLRGPDGPSLGDCLSLDLGVNFSKSQVEM